MDASLARSDMSRPPVNSVVQAVSVLRHLGSLPEGQGVTAIARAVGISPSSCFNILKTLVAEDLVGFDPVTKHYALGLGAIDLARNALGRDAVVRAAQGPMAQLAERFDAAIGLWRVTERHRLMLAALAESEAGTRIHMVVGQRQPEAAGATGRAILAMRGLDDEEMVRAHAGIRWQNAPSVSEYSRQVREAEQRGWAIDTGNIHHGVTSVSAPICDMHNRPRFALSASTFTGRETPEGLAVIGEAVRRLACEVGQAAFGSTGSDHG